MARETAAVEFADISTLFPAGDASYYVADRIHPSPKGSQAIAARLIAIIERIEKAEKTVQ